jgi:hypothetical protein
MTVKLSNTFTNWPGARSPLLFLPVLWHRFGQKLIDSSEQFELRFCILLFAVLDNVLQLNPEELNFGFTKSCHAYTLPQRTHVLQKQFIRMSAMLGPADE